MFYDYIEIWSLDNDPRVVISTKDKTIPGSFTMNIKVPGELLTFKSIHSLVSEQIGDLRPHYTLVRYTVTKVRTILSLGVARRKSVCICIHSSRDNENNYRDCHNEGRGFQSSNASYWSRLREACKNVTFPLDTELIASHHDKSKPPHDTSKTKLIHIKCPP